MIDRPEGDQVWAVLILRQTVSEETIATSFEVYAVAQSRETANEIASQLAPYLGLDLLDVQVLETRLVSSSYQLSALSI
jgi:hypothetical protein